MQETVSPSPHHSDEILHVERSAQHENEESAKKRGEIRKQPREQMSYMLFQRNRQNRVRKAANAARKSSERAIVCVPSL